MTHARTLKHIWCDRCGKNWYDDALPVEDEVYSFLCEECIKDFKERGIEL